MVQAHVLEGWMSKAREVLFWEGIGKSRMDVIMLFDPGIRSWNKGDEIIMRSAETALSERGILDNAFVVHAATHAPVVTRYQNTSRNPHMKIYDNAKYKFICGSNILWKNMRKPLPSMNANPFNCRPYAGSILMGTGIGQSEDKVNGYTKRLYGKILSKDWIHSTRDARTADFLQSLGYDAIDTGCPTMWRFTPDFCKDIPHEKSRNVVFTLTDYGKDYEHDQRLMEILKEHYETVYFWIQGVRDKEYFDSLEGTDGIHVIPPSPDAYSQVLTDYDIDYVGTRLHAGLFAMQHKKRTIILAIDNRVRDMKKSYALHTLERNALESLPEYIESEFATDIHLKQNHIDRWVEQFMK